MAGIAGKRGLWAAWELGLHPEGLEPSHCPKEGLLPSHQREFESKHKNLLFLGSTPGDSDSWVWAWGPEIFIFKNLFQILAQDG